jgi:hypothetical protein
MANETAVVSSLLMDRSEPLGNSPDASGRRRLHTLVTNTSGEPIFNQFVPIASARITIISVSDSAWVALPSIPFTGRASLIIQNTHPKQNLYINYTNTAPLQQGFIVYPEGTRELVLAESVQVYGVMDVGFTANVIVEEGAP